MKTETIKISIVLFCAFALASCTGKQKEFSNVTSGMTKNEVIAQAGEPTEKNDLLMAELWVYKNADRTVVFRGDTVYDIITSAEARIDSIEGTLKETGNNLEQKLEATGDTIDSASLRLKNRISGDSSTRN